MNGQVVESSQNRRQLDIELDIFEQKLSELRNLYEQHFSGIVVQPPTKMHDETKRDIRRLLRAPFKNSATKFRLRTIINRYHTYATYWERVLKQKEDGTYNKDLFKAELREKITEEMKVASSKTAKTEQSIKLLYKSVQSAMKSSGLKADQINYEKFRGAVEKKVSVLRAANPNARLAIKVAINNGRVSIKASAK
jgi:hypothetical protein